MSYTDQLPEFPNKMPAPWAAFTDPTPFIEEMSERMGMGNLPNLFQAISAMQTEALRIAVHAPFVPFHIYAEALKIETPLTQMMSSAEDAAAHVVETMNHNSEVLQQQTEQLVEAVAAPVQKSASPRARTASGPTAGSGA